MAADQLNRLTNVCDDSLNADIARVSLQASKLSMFKSAFFPGKNEYETERGIAFGWYSTQLSVCDLLVF